MRYMETLAAAAPARMKIFEYAKTWEGRKLIYAAIGSEANNSAPWKCVAGFVVYWLAAICST